MFVFGAAGWGEDVGVGFLESAFLAEVVEGLGGEGDEFLDAEFFGAVFGEKHEFAADALVFVGG